MQTEIAQAFTAKKEVQAFRAELQQLSSSRDDISFVPQAENRRLEREIQSLQAMSNSGSISRRPRKIGAAETAVATTESAVAAAVSTVPIFRGLRLMEPELLIACSD